MELTADQALQQGISAHKAGKLQEAEELYRAILSSNPQHADANHNLGVLAVNVGKVNDALPFFKLALEINPQQPQFWLSYIDALIKLGKLDYAKQILQQGRMSGIKGDNLDRLEVELGRLESRNIKIVGSLEGPSEQQIEKLIALFGQGELEEAFNYGNGLSRQYPTYHVIPNILGAVCAGLGKNEEAIVNYNRAIELKPDYSEAHNNLGNFFRNIGQNNEALQCYNKAIEINPYSPAACLNLGLVLKDLYKFHEAIESYNRAIKLKPDYAEAHNNLGNTLSQLRRYEEAIESFNKAIDLKPDYAEAHNNLGNILNQLRRYEEAIESFTKAIELRPGYPNAYNNFGITLCSVKAKVFSNSLAENFLDVFTKENIVSPTRMLPAIVTLLKHHETIKDAINCSKNNKLERSGSELCIGLSQIPLFTKILEICPIPDLEIEKVLTGLRRYLLLDGRKLSTNKNLLHFQCVLAHQCFTNEFIYEETERETVAIKLLEESIQKSFLDDKEIQLSDVACLGSFRPLSGYSWIDSSTHLSELGSLLKRQVIEVKQELHLKNGIPRLAPSTDEISLAVQKQYENNPYPRWVKTKLEMGSTTLTDWMAQTNLRVINDIKSLSEKPQILVAGCGTGQHALSVASRFENSHVTAVDLSLSSLGYAKRKTEELGITNIDYLQADILNLGMLKSQFDIIESVGVLHHMSDPVTGWEILTDCLKRHGLMKIGLYSALGRQHVSKMGNKVTEKNNSFNEREMVKIRCQIINSGDFNLDRLKNIPDFYSTSMFRDLLFHAQEHRFTIPKINEVLQTLGLAFLGFEFSDDLLKVEFEKSNPQKEALYDLNKWHEFEESNPSVFSGMYQFWVQKL